MSRFIEKILKLLSSGKIGVFGLKLVTDKTAREYEDSLSKRINLSNQNSDLERKIFKLEEDLRTLKSQNESLMNREVVDVFTGDPSPVDTEKRKLYVAQVAGLHKEILEPKLKYMISESLKILESSTNDREFDQAVKGTIYALREIIRWGDMMVNEQVATLSENK